MKKFLERLAFLAILAMVAATVSCGDDDDDGKKEEEDLENPTVTISAPADGSTVSSLDATVDVTIQYQATDDIELSSVVVEFDGTQIEEVTEFVDFRSYNGEVVQSAVADGEYTITVTATDVSGKTGSASSTFTKETLNPYEPLDGEIAYLPFEGNYVDLVTESEVGIVGSPSFAGEGKEGDNAYQGADGAYLTIPNDDFAATTTVLFWMKVNAAADRAGVMALSAEDTENPDAQNNRTKGFRILREASGDLQIFKANFGTGEADVWLDGGDFAKLDPTDGEWHHFALVLDETSAGFYIDGAKVAEQEDVLPMDLTGTEALSVMSGAPRFVGWNHFSDGSSMDELRIFNKALDESELATIVGIDFGTPEWDPDPGLEPVDGPDAVEVMYMSFDTDFSIEGLDVTATEVGTPTVVDGGVSGKAYMGAADSYLTIPAEALMNDEFSASFWIKVNATPDRAGLLVIGAPDTAEAQNNRTKGFRFFRENAAGDQRFKLNVGGGDADSWADGGEYADIPGDVTDWRHVAITISATKAQVYLNGILVTSSDVNGLSWDDCDILSFGSGAPRFTGWNHLADESMFDELRIYSGVLNPAQIAALKAVGD